MDKENVLELLENVLDNNIKCVTFSNRHSIISEKIIQIVETPPLTVQDLFSKYGQLLGLLVEYGEAAELLGNNMIEQADMLREIVNALRDLSED